MNTGLDSVTTPYCGPVMAPDQILWAWNGDPWLLGGLACAGLGVLWHRSQSGSDAVRDRALIVAAVGLSIAFISPLCAATVALFAFRTLHHLILLCVVAPALAVALPARMLPAAAGLGLTSVVLVLWHVPSVYDAAWQSAAFYWALQFALLVPAWLFWSAVLRPAPRADTLFGHALLVGGLAGVMGLIGAVLVFAPRPYYPQHLVGAEAFGTSLLADQHLAGLIMWVPGFVPLAACAFWMLRQGWKNGFAA